MSVIWYVDYIRWRIAFHQLTDPHSNRYKLNHSTNSLFNNISLTFSRFSKSTLIRRLALFLNWSVRGLRSFWCITIIIFLSTLSKFLTEFVNSIDFSSIGPISSQMITSQLFSAVLSLSAANLHPSRLTKYFPTLGPFPKTYAKTLVSFVTRSTNSNPTRMLLILISLDTTPPTFSPLFFSIFTECITAVVFPIPGAPVRIRIVIILFLVESKIKSEN